MLQLPLTLVLPWPPSENRYRRCVIVKDHAQALISAEGREYKHAVRAAVPGIYLQNQPLEGELRMDVILHPPSRRKMDLDNRMKALQDALEAAHVFRDDAQIKRLCIELGAVVPDGRALVRLSKWTSTRLPFTPAYDGVCGVVA